MELIHYKPNRNGGWDVRTVEGKRGEVVKKRGKFVAPLTRNVSLAALDGICTFVADLNR